jgi:septation ring formation regulator EzrA
MKIFVAICAIFIFCEYAEAYCTCWCCEDVAQIQIKGTKAVTNFLKLDKEVAGKINDIKSKISDNHNTLEKDSKTLLENIRKLNRQYYIVEQNILHNQALINELQNIVIDTIATNGEVQKSKNNLELLKQEVSK